MHRNHDFDGSPDRPALPRGDPASGGRCTWLTCANAGSLISARARTRVAGVGALALIVLGLPIAAYAAGAIDGNGPPTPGASADPTIGEPTQPPASTPPSSGSAGPPSSSATSVPDGRISLADLGNATLNLPVISDLRVAGAAVEVHAHEKGPVLRRGARTVPSQWRQYSWNGSRFDQTGVPTAFAR